ncbi:hypothetical protein [Chryseobacterium sp. P1-3]|uniref:hypothetical protein n=1 Tax=Chryseobacterium sp. (strain P1-3) TaxID=1517683 RepID=UPI000AEAD5ED|nr:hypothetical protein [Chryseobacterium sp. P1-3]
MIGFHIECFVVPAPNICGYAGMTDPDPVTKNEIHAETKNKNRRSKNFSGIILINAN